MEWSRPFFIGVVPALASGFRTICHVVDQFQRRLQAFVFLGSFSVLLVEKICNQIVIIYQALLPTILAGSVATGGGT